MRAIDLGSRERGGGGRRDRGEKGGDHGEEEEEEEEEGGGGGGFSEDYHALFSQIHLLFKTLCYPTNYPSVKYSILIT